MAKTDAPPRPDCGHEDGRLERYEATAPDNTVLAIVRCTWCGAETLTPVGKVATEVGPTRMVPGSPKESVGPEDALGDEPTRGDYSDRLGATAGSHEARRRQA